MNRSESPGREPQIDTGHRHGETHYETDADQQVRVAHLTKPDAPLPRQEGTTLAGQQTRKPGPPTEDVKVDASESSVWDGRPPQDRAFQDVPAAGPPQASPLNGGRDGDALHPVGRGDTEEVEGGLELGQGSGRQREA